MGCDNFCVLLLLFFWAGFEPIDVENGPVLLLMQAAAELSPVWCCFCTASFRHPLNVVLALVSFCCFYPLETERVPASNLPTFCRMSNRFAYSLDVFVHLHASDAVDHAL